MKAKKETLSEIRKDQQETAEAVNEALAEKGNGRPAAKVHAELRKKYFHHRRPKHRSVGI